MKNSKFQETFAPTVVLLLICLVVTTALAFTNQATAPQIEKINKANADAARAEVLSEADGFTAYDGKLNDGVDEYYIATNKCGAVITSRAKSFGGDITVMTGINKDGKITGVKVTNHADTPGLGTKAHDPEYLKCYIDKDTLAAENIKDESSVNYIVGATVSSNGVYHAVQEALQQFKDAGGVK